MEFKDPSKGTQGSSHLPSSGRSSDLRFGLEVEMHTIELTFKFESASHQNPTASNHLNRSCNETSKPGLD
jgi:hypothetical protein